MLKVSHRAGIVVMVLGALMFPCTVRGQIAPTNSSAISGSVSDSQGDPVAYATVSLNGPKNGSTHTDARGLFVFIGVPSGAYQISVTAAGFGTATRSVSVQGDTNVAIQYEPISDKNLKTIASVSASANANFNVTSASITQVSPLQNALNGKTSWRTILEQIPGIAQAGLGYGNYAVAAIPDGPLVPMKISIDGGFPYETATLLDDMPLIGTSIGQPAGSGTNLAVYPLNGFGAADVVRGPSASSPSILDSIGGSFVLHAPGAVSQNTYELSVSNDAYGGIVINGLAAVRAGKFSLTATYGVNDSPGPIATNGIPGIPASYLGILTVDGSPFTPYAPPCNPPGCVSDRLVNPVYGGGNIANSVYGYTEGLLLCCGPQTTVWSQHTGSLAARYAVSPRLNAEIFYAGSVTNMPQQPSPSYTSAFSPPAGYTGAVPTGDMQLLASGDTFAQVPYHQGSNLLEEKITAQIGTGIVTLAALQNRSFCSYTFAGPTAVSLQLFGGGNGNIYNGSTHLVTFAPESETETSNTNNRDMLLSYQTPIGDRYHAGASLVSSYYDIPSTNIFFYYGFPVENDDLPSAISDTTKELRIFAGGNLSEKVSFDLSQYFTTVGYHVPSPSNTVAATTPGANLAYTDVNYTYDAPRLGIVWRPTAATALRAAAGGGFATSALSDLVGSPPANSFAGYYSQKLANITVQPERSFSFDLGTDLRLRRNTTLSFDVYRSNLYGQLFASTTLTSLNYAGTGLPLYSTQFENLGASRFEGVLLDLHHDVPRGIYWVLSGGLTRGYIVSVPASVYNAAHNTCNFTTTVGCQNLNLVPGINFNGTMNAGPGSGSAQTGVSIPYAQGLGTIGYRWNPAKFVDLTMTYYGNNNTYFRSAFVEFDGNIGYPLTKNISLLVNFSNITNIYGSPIQITSAGSFLGAPTLAGPLYAERGEEYGPRSVIVTTNIHF